MRIIDLPEFRDKSDILTMSKTDTVHAACVKMRERHCGSVIITEKGKLIGIFTERDLLRKVAAEKGDVTKLKLKDVMSTNLKTATPEDEIADSMRRMTQGKFRHLPVVDNQGHVIGILSQGDFIAHSWADLFKGLTQTARTSFMSNTQLWILVLCIFIYVTVLMAAFR